MDLGDRLGQSDYISMVLLAMQSVAIIIGLLILGWMLAVHRRARREQKSFVDALGFLPLRSDAPMRPCLLAGHPLGLHGGGQNGAEPQPGGAVFLGGRIGWQP